MKDNENYNKIANKLANIDDKFIEIESIIKMLNIWVSGHAGREGSCGAGALCLDRRWVRRIYVLFWS